jgi:hypothetical protein
MIDNNLNWNKLKCTYTENQIKNKSLPEIYDFYDLSKDFKNVYEPAEDTFLISARKGKKLSLAKIESLHDMLVAEI